jgi:hypothetical protein
MTTHTQQKLTFQEVRSNFFNKQVFYCFILIFVGFLFGCEQKKVESKIVSNQKDTVKKVLKDTLQKINNEPNRELGFDNIESLEDTLAKYKESKELKILNCVESVGCYFEIRIGNFLQNGKRNAVVIIEKTGQLLLYNLENEVWQRIFELENSFVCGYDNAQETVKFEDMNGDNKVDILSISGVNYSTMVWYNLYLYQPKQKVWERIPFFDQEIPNPKFNHKNGLLYSYSFGSTYALQTRALYQWKGNEFILKEEYSQTFVEQQNGNKTKSYYVIHHYLGRDKNGKKILKKEYQSRKSIIDTLLFSLEEYDKIE